MKYRASYYISILSDVAKFYVNIITSFQFGIAVIFTGIFAIKMMEAFGVSQHIQDVVFLPCVVFFLWSFCMSAIDHSIDRSSTL